MSVCAIYLRISQDELKTELGVERQKEECLALAAKRGYEVYKIYCDNDISAWKSTDRPDYAALIADAGAGKFDRIITKHQSRLWRNRAERGFGIDYLGRLKLTLTLSNGEERNLGTSDGRNWADMMGTRDSAESDVKSERVHDAAVQRASQGRPNSFVPYGWSRIYTSVSPKQFHDVEDVEEASVVREIVDRLLANDSLHAIVRDLNARQVPTPRRRLTGWTLTMARNIAIRPANIAQRVAGGRVVADAQWPAIVDPDKFHRLVAVINQRKTNKKREGRRRHLLTLGIAECGKCHGQLSARSVPSPQGRRWIYRCDAKYDLSRDLIKTDAVVGQRLIRILRNLDLAELLNPPDDAGELEAARSRVAGLEARLKIAGDKFASGEWNAETVDRATESIRAALVAARAEVQHLSPVVIPPNAQELTGPDAETVWHALDVSAKRELLEALDVKVVIQPSTSDQRFDPDDILIGLNLRSINLFKSGPNDLTPEERQAELARLGSILRSTS